MVLGERLGVDERAVVRWVRAPPALHGLVAGIRLHGVTGYCDEMAAGEAWRSARTARQRRPQPTSAPQARLDLLEVNPATSISSSVSRCRDRPDSRLVRSPIRGRRPVAR